MKSKPVKGKAKSDVKKESADLNFKHGSESNLEKEKTSNIETENKLAITKPWFSRSEINQKMKALKIES